MTALSVLQQFSVLIVFLLPPSLLIYFSALHEMRRQAVRAAPDRWFAVFFLQGTMLILRCGCLGFIFGLEGFKRFYGIGFDLESGVVEIGAIAILYLVLLCMLRELSRCLLGREIADLPAVQKSHITTLASDLIVMIVMGLVALEGGSNLASQIAGVGAVVALAGVGLWCKKGLGEISAAHQKRPLHEPFAPEMLSEGKADKYTPTH